MYDTIYFLWEYNWYAGKLVSEGPKNYKIVVNIPGFRPHFRSVAKERCARPGESVCVVWEQWRGTNGRGGYRVERELYPQHRVPAERVARQHLGLGRVSERALGIEQ